MTEPLGPDRLTRLMHDAVQRVTVPPDALDRIHQGVRRRRAVRHAGAAVLAAAVIAGGSVTAMAVTSGGAGPGATSSAGTGPVAAPTATSALADLAAPARFQPYIPPPSLSSVSGNNVGDGDSGTTQPVTSSTPPYREMPPAPSS